MRPREPDDGFVDILEQGGDAAPRPGLRAAGLAALLIAVGAAAGVALDRTAQGLGAGDTVEILAGPMYTSDGPELFVPLYNAGDRDVQLVNLFPQGWRGSAPQTELPPGRWVGVPVDVDADCYAPPATRRLVLRLEAGGEDLTRTVRMPVVPRRLVERRQLGCPRPEGVTAGPEDLVGVWAVEGAPDYDFVGNRLVLRFHRDGRFALDIWDRLFTDNPSMFGTYTFEAGRALLRSQGGADCPPGDRLLIAVNRLPEGYLRIRPLDSLGGDCSLDGVPAYTLRPLSRGPLTEARP